MAGIEKICEFSDRYEHSVDGFNMYAAKKNQLQIMPEYRKLFRGADAELFIEFDDIFIRDKGRDFRKWMTFSDLKYEWEEDTNANPPSQKLAYLTFLKYYMWLKKKRIGIRYRYTLVVKNPELQGQVKGQYKEWTSSLSTMRRKLRRLTRNYKLKINFDESSALKELYVNRVPRFITPYKDGVYKHA